MIIYIISHAIFFHAGYSGKNRDELFPFFRHYFFNFTACFSTFLA